MRKVTPSFLAALSCVLPLTMQAENQAEASPSVKASELKSAPFSPFTGKVTKNKVRLRLQPSFDGPVLRELQRNDLLVITGETEDFYLVQPSKEMKAYVFRTYVLDNVVEGTRVNVRLKPDLDAPVIAQLNSGDRVNGRVDHANNKWLEIPMPPSAHFYVAKEYIEKIGDADLLAKLEKKREEGLSMLHAANANGAIEIQKPFPNIALNDVIATYNHLLSAYADFPEISTKAKEQLAALQESYTSKKLAYLERQAQQSASVLELKNRQLADELKSYKNKIFDLENQVNKAKSTLAEASPTIAPEVIESKKVNSLPINILSWMPVEDTLFKAWSQRTGVNNMDAFYREQQKGAFILKGVVDNYNRAVKNKPGDYMLVHSSSKLPIAFLYSTKVNLQDYVGHEISVLVAPRSNNYFAYPAYFVLSVE